MRVLQQVAKLSASYEFSISHSKSLKRGTLTDIYTANRILTGYAKCSDINAAYKLFEEISHKDIVSWNSLISGFINHGELNTAWFLLRSMRKDGISIDEYTFGSILKGVAYNESLDYGQQVHTLIIKMGFEGNIYSGSALLDMYAKCERVDDSRKVFECMPERNIISWNALISGYAQFGDRQTTFRLLDHMDKESMRLDDGTFSPILTLLDDPKYYRLVLQIRAKIIKNGLESNTTCCNATITAYSECGSIEDAKKVFNDSVGVRDLVTWNSMLAAYIVHNKGELAIRLFIEMQELGFKPDIYTYTSIISSIFEEMHQNQGKSFHGFVIKRGFESSIPVANSLISMYVKSNGKFMEEAITIFETMEVKDRVSWNSIIKGFSQNGFSESALNYFRQMQLKNLVIDQFTFSAVLRSCSDLATLQLGQQIHLLVTKTGLEFNEYVGSSLIFMYSKCGIIADAKKSFGSTSKESSITWNSIIFAYAQHGLGKLALEYFKKMRERQVKLDYITFVAVLTACSHSGLVEEGKEILKSMESVYGIPLRMEHYACGIDLFGRALLLDEAKALMESMPFDPDPMVWKTLLGACRMCGDIELASQVARCLIELEPDEHCTYVILSKMYGHLKKWDDKASLKRMMKERGVRKVPGWSWIEVQNKVHAFNAEDHSHPRCEELYQMLGDLTEEVICSIP